MPLDILKVQQLLKPQVFRGMNNEYIPERIGDTCVIPKVPQALKAPQCLQKILHLMFQLVMTGSS
jgi:hypothetical protein